MGRYGGAGARAGSSAGGSLARRPCGSVGPGAFFDRSPERVTIATVERVARVRGKTTYTVWRLRGDFAGAHELATPAPSLDGPPVVAGTRLEARFRPGLFGYRWGTIRRAP